jgi:hypothetical protein
MAQRSYFYKYDQQTGANVLDISRVAMDQGILTSNMTILADAYARSHTELSIQDNARSDGIRADGAFGQHDGLLYNGNYGMLFSNFRPVKHVDGHL